MEEWKQYIHIANLWVSNMGNVKFICPKKKEIPIKPSYYGKYYHIKVCNSNGINLHKLVAEVFIPNPEFKSYVKHINGNIKDNRVSNLEWVKRNSGKGRKNTDGMTISTSSTESPVTISDDCKLVYVKEIDSWCVFLKNGTSFDCEGVFKTKDEAEMAVPYQNEFY